MRGQRRLPRAKALFLALRRCSAMRDALGVFGVTVQARASYNRSSAIMSAALEVHGCLPRAMCAVGETCFCCNPRRSVKGHCLPRLFVWLIGVFLKGFVPLYFAEEAMSSVEAVSSRVGRCVEDTFAGLAPPSVSPSGYHARPSLWFAICEARNVSPPQMATKWQRLLRPSCGPCGFPQFLRPSCCSSRESREIPVPSATFGHHLAMRRVLRTVALTACSSFLAQRLDPGHHARHGNTDNCQAHLLTVLDPLARKRGAMLP